MNTPAYDLAEGLLSLGWRLDPERHKAWVHQSFRLARGDAHLSVLIQAVGKLDAILCALERDAVLIMTSTETSRAPFGPDFQVVLSSAWISQAYEVVRTIAHNTDDEDLRALKVKLSLVRMPMFKGEIAYTNRAREPGTPSRPMTKIGLNDGSVVWQVERKLGDEVDISRRDIADRIIALKIADAT